MDRQLRLQILKAAVRDRDFLKLGWRDIKPEDFPEREEEIIAQAAVNFYSKYQTPIGVMLQAAADEEAHRRKLGGEGRKKLRELCGLIQSTKLELVSVRALVDRLQSLKKSSFYNTALDEILTANEKGELTVQTLAGIVEKADRELYSKKADSRDYLSEADQRIYRRASLEEPIPYFLIAPLDQKIKSIARGQLAIFLAPPGGGKGLALLHMSVAYALQGNRVLHFSLEDPKRTVEDRLDSCLTGIPKSRLQHFPIKFKNRFRRMKAKIKGSLRLVDGTDGGWSVTEIEKCVDQHIQEGFSPDAIIVDYDDEIECEKQFKGDNARRFEFAEVYRRLRRMAAKTNTYVWTAAQTNQNAIGKKVVTARNVAEDFSKIRKVFLAIGIGTDPEDMDIKYLYVMKHRNDRAHFGVEIRSDYDSSIFYVQADPVKRRNGHGA